MVTFYSAVTEAKVRAMLVSKSPRPPRLARMAGVVAGRPAPFTEGPIKGDLYLTQMFIRPA